MNKQLKQLCAVAMVITLLLTPLAVLSANAQETPDNTNNKTGDLGIYEPADTETPVISSVVDYNKYTNKSYIGKATTPLIKSSILPESVDNSQSPYFPQIGDQGGLGTCVVFATTYYQFTYTMNKALGIKTTEDNTFSVKWVYNLVNHGSDNGSTAYTIYKLLKQHGCPTAKSLPYDGVDFKGWSTDEKIWREAMRYRLSDSQQFRDIGTERCEITSNNDTDLTAIKTALSNGDILKFSSYIYSWEYDNLKTNANAPENYKYNNETYVRLVSGHEGGHGMAIVGYNDNIWCDINGNNIVDSGEMGAFKIANSWSEAYGNDGFMWIAYDALNEISCVNNVEHITERQPAVEDVYRIDVCDSYEGDDIYLKFTLNTADRSQFSVCFDADKNGSEYKNYFLNGAGYYTASNNYAFDGTKNACDATFVYPLNDLDPEITPENFEQYNFRITIKDNNKDSIPLTVKNISLVNEHTNSEYKTNANYPIVLDGSEFTASVKESSKTNAVIYYIGYDNPTLYYKPKNGTFTTVSMEENSERIGALYKYVIYDITDDITLCFSNGKGLIDNNQGKYYTAKQGLNFYYTKNQRSHLTIKDFNLSNGTPDVSKRCLFDVDVTGGYENYMYKYTIENLSTGEIKNYDFNYNYDLSPYIFTNEGTFRITVEVMDYAKETSSLTKEIKVTNQPFQIDSVTPDRSAVLVSKNVQFSSVTVFEASYGSYSAKSRFVVKDSNGKVWRDEVVKYSTYDIKLKSTTTHFNFVPEKSGTYTLTVSSEDSNKEYAEKTISFIVYDMTIGDTNGDGIINIKDATTLQQYLAESINKTQNYKELSDCDGNSSINIKDVTSIQRYIINDKNCGNTGQIVEYIPPTQPTTEPTTQPTTVPPTTQPTTTPVVNNKVTFTNSLRWSGTIYCYYWSDSNTTMTSWPGKAMTNIGLNDYSESLYTFEVPKEATYIIFSNGSNQTVDISYNGGEIKYYALNTKTGNGYNVATW